MIKKFKRYYGNLLDYQKVRFRIPIYCILVYILICILLGFYFFSAFPNDSPLSLILGTLGFAFYESIFAWMLLIMKVEFKAQDLELNYKLKKAYEENEQIAKKYFDKADKNVIKIIPKDFKNISDIIEYFYKRNVLIESYWVEKDKDKSGDSIYYLLVTCKDKEERIVYPEVIKNFGYFISYFTFPEYEK